MPDRKTRGGFGFTDLLLLLMAVIWAVNFSVVKFVTRSFDALAFTALRVIIAAVVLLAIALAQSRKWPPRRDLLALMAVGLLGNGLYQLFFVQGMTRVRAGDAALIVAATPAFVAIASQLRGIERIRRRTAAGIALSFVGVGLVVFGSSRSVQGESTLFGALLIFCGVLCWAGFTILLQPFTKRIDPIQLSATTMTGGMLLMLCVAPAALIRMDWASVPASAWMGLLYASVLSMVVAYLFWYRGLRILGPTRTAIYGNVQPMIAILVAWMFLGETLTAWQGVGTLTIVGGVFMTRS